MNAGYSPKIDVPFSFTRRPRPIPPDLRPDWRVSVLLLILHYSHGRKASIKKLNLINWAIRSSKNRDVLLNQLISEKTSSGIIIRIEPGLSRAIDFAKGHGLIEIEYAKKTRVKLTSEGEAKAKKIDDLKDCFTKERNFLVKIKPYVKEKDIDVLYTGGK